MSSTGEARIIKKRILHYNNNKKKNDLFLQRIDLAEEGSRSNSSNHGVLCSQHMPLCFTSVEESYRVTRMCQLTEVPVQQYLSPSENQPSSLGEEIWVLI